MANQTVYPYGTGGSLPSSVGIINDCVTGGADKALSAEQGVVLQQEIESLRGEPVYYTLIWNTGDIKTNDQINTAYANKYVDYIQLLSQNFVLNNQMSSYKVSVIWYDTNKTRISSLVCNSDTSTTFDFPSSAKYVRLLAWDKPSDSDVLDVTASYMPELSLSDLQEEIDSLSGGNTYSNPVLQQNCADPCIVDGQDGYFYLYFTGGLGTIVMRRTPNFIDWETADSPFTAQAVANCLADLNVQSAIMWAPEIVKVGNKYNLYCSKEANPMVVFQSEHPYFGYEYAGKIITTSNGLTNDNIDACVRYDLDGTLWMFWGSTYGIYRQKLTAGGLTLDANDTKVHVAGKLLSQDSSRATVFEGAYLYRKKGYWYMFVSAGLYSNYTYCIKVGRCSTLSGTFVDADGNDMADGYGTTILSSSNGETLYGPGHNGLIFTDRNNKTYMVYHSHYTGTASTAHRYICLQELLWNEETGWPYFGNGGKPQVAGNIKPVL